MSNNASYHVKLNSRKFTLAEVNSLQAAVKALADHAGLEIKDLHTEQEGEGFWFVIETGSDQALGEVELFYTL